LPTVQDRRLKGLRPKRVEKDENPSVAAGVGYWGTEGIIKKWPWTTKKKGGAGLAKNPRVSIQHREYNLAPLEEGIKARHGKQLSKKKPFSRKGYPSGLPSSFPKNHQVRIHHSQFSRGGVRPGVGAGPYRRPVHFQRKGIGVNGIKGPGIHTKDRPVLGPPNPPGVGKPYESKRGGKRF